MESSSNSESDFVSGLVTKARRISLKPAGRALHAQQPTENLEDKSREEKQETKEHARQRHPFLSDAKPGAGKLTNGNAVLGPIFDIDHPQSVVVAVNPCFR